MADQRTKVRPIRQAAAAVIKAGLAAGVILPVAAVGSLFLADPPDGTTRPAGYVDAAADCYWMPAGNGFGWAWNVVEQGPDPAVGRSQSPVQFEERTLFEMPDYFRVGEWNSVSRPVPGYVPKPGFSRRIRVLSLGMPLLFANIVEDGSEPGGPAASGGLLRRFDWILGGRELSLHWGRLIASWCGWTALVFGARFVWRDWLAGYRARRGRCFRCGYAVKINCPECGCGTA